MSLVSFVGCLTSQQQASVSLGRICSDKFMCCHTEIEVADQTFYLIHSQYADTGPTCHSADPIMPGTWQGSTRVPIFKSLVWLNPEKSPWCKQELNLGSSALEEDTLTAGLTRQSVTGVLLLSCGTSLEPPVHEADAFASRPSSQLINHSAYYFPWIWNTLK